jgi:acetamidase/formamidase
MQLRQAWHCLPVVTLLLPVVLSDAQVAGALLSMGDAHVAQGE